jgi:hypothetical protein
MSDDDAISLFLVLTGGLLLVASLALAMTTR